MTLQDFTELQRFFYGKTITNSHVQALREVSRGVKSSFLQRVLNALADAFRFGTGNETVHYIHLLRDDANRNKQYIALHTHNTTRSQRIRIDLSCGLESGFSELSVPDLCAQLEQAQARYQSDEAPPFFLVADPSRCLYLASIGELGPLSYFE